MTRPADKSFVEEIKSFIAQFSCIEIAKISLETALMKDLLIDGDDAVDLLIAFSREFQVDLLELDMTGYFNAEGFNLFSSGKKNLKPLTVERLVNAAQVGKWQEG